MNKIYLNNLKCHFSRNKALDRGNSSAQDSPNQSLTETPPSNKIFESSSLDTTGIKSFTDFILFFNILLSIKTALKGVFHFVEPGQNLMIRSY